MYVFYYKHFDLTLRSFSKLIGNDFNDLTEGGRFYINTSRALKMESYISRCGEWSDPFVNECNPNFTMPLYNPNFNLSFEEVSDRRANDIRNLIIETDRPIIVQWSGGIDSTVSLVSLIKNLSINELKRIKISMNGGSIVENPHFFQNFIKDKFEILNSEENLYNDYKEKYNAFVISSDTGDCTFGAELGIKMYSLLHEINNELENKIRNDIDRLHKGIASPDIHYSEYRDFIVYHYNNCVKKNADLLNKSSILNNSLGTYDRRDLDFGDLFYEKVNKNIKDSGIPLHSLHDFFWWTIFNMKYNHCALRGAATFSVGSNKKDLIEDCIIQWFSSKEYQLWSLKNNNNGLKIIGATQGSYKYVAKKYIYDFDKNEYYFNHKIKQVSLPHIMKRNWKRYFNDLDPILGMDKNYDIINLGNPQTDGYVKDCLVNYKIDWI